MSTVENIRVVVRVKPLTEEDEASTYENIVDVCDDNQTLILLPNGKKIDQLLNLLTRTNCT